MDLVKPEFGLIFWMSVTFLIVLFLLKKFAWKPILGIIKEREASIEKAINTAEEARKEMRELRSLNDKLAADARIERDKILKEAREIKDSIINDAKKIASEEGNRIVAAAREQINAEKFAAINELKNQVASLSIDIAEKILKSELSNEEKQKTLVKNLLQDIKLN